MHNSIEGGSRRIRPWKLVLVLAASVLALGTIVAACGGDDDDDESDAVATDCPFDGGEVRAFAAIDQAGNAGELGLGTDRSAQLAVDLINREGGILGCEFVLDLAEEGFPEIEPCLREYRQALSEGEYDFYFGPTGSGCMAALPELTNAAGRAIIANQAADHQPFFDPQFEKFSFHAAVSTFLEGRAVATFAADKGWGQIGMLAPNYAYGQDVAASFSEYFERIAADGEIVSEQLPEFDERNFTPFINATVASGPDAVVSAFFGDFVLPFWRQWQDGGHDNIPHVAGLVDTPGWERVERSGQIPENSYAYDRGAWQFAQLTPTGQEFHDAYVAEHGDTDHPLPLAWGQAFWSGVLMAKSLIETTESLDPDDWVAAVETGDFTFPSPYHVGETPVDPINHMADTCAQVGLLTYDEEHPVPASFDLSDFSNICMHDILEADEAAELTSNEDVTEEAIEAYQEKVEEVNEEDDEVFDEAFGG